MRESSSRFQPPFLEAEIEDVYQHLQQELGDDTSSTRQGDISGKDSTCVFHVSCFHTVLYNRQERKSTTKRKVAIPLSAEPDSSLAEDTMAKDKTDKPDTPEILTLELVTFQDEGAWDDDVTVAGNQIAAASDKQLTDLRTDIKEMAEKKEKENVFSEIAEVQRILKAKPLKRDADGKIVLHKQADVPIVEDFDIEENRPRNRILWAISDQLKGKNAKDVKKITIKFGLIADIKKPKYSDAELLANLVGFDTEKTRGLSEAWPNFRDKFVPPDWDNNKSASKDGCLLTESKRIQDSIK